MIPIASLNLKSTLGKNTTVLLTHSITPSATIKTPKTSDINPPKNLSVFIKNITKCQYISYMYGLNDLYNDVDYWLAEHEFFFDLLET